MAEMFKIEIDDQAVQTMLKDLSRKAEDLSPLMRQTAGIMHDAVEQNFDQEGRPKWKGLSQSTINRREKKGHWPGKILQVKGQLAASINEQHSKDFALVGTNKKYARAHQEGFSDTVSVSGFTRRQKSRDVREGRKTVAKGIAFVKAHSRQMNIPARPFLNVTDRELRKILDAGEGFLQPR